MALIRRAFGCRNADEADEAAVAEARRRRKKLAGVNWDCGPDPVDEMADEMTDEMYDKLDAAVANVPGFVDYAIDYIACIGPGSFSAEVEITTDDERYDQTWYWTAGEDYWDPA